MPVYPENPPTKPSEQKVIHPECGEYDLCVEIECELHSREARIFHIKSMIIIPMAAHPTFFEEGIIQFKSFFDAFGRTVEIALNDYLDKHASPPPTPDGTVALDMEVKLPSADKSASPSTDVPLITIKPAVPPADGQPSP